MEEEREEKSHYHDDDCKSPEDSGNGPSIPPCSQKWAERTQNLKKGMRNIFDVDSDSDDEDTMSVDELKDFKMDKIMKDILSCEDISAICKRPHSEILEERATMNEPNRKIVFDQLFAEIVENQLRAGKDGKVDPITDEFSGWFSDFAVEIPSSVPVELEKQLDEGKIDSMDADIASWFSDFVEVSPSAPDVLAESPPLASIAPIKDSVPPPSTSKQSSQKPILFTFEVLMPFDSAVTTSQPMAATSTKCSRQKGGKRNCWEPRCKSKNKPKKRQTASAEIIEEWAILSGNKFRTQYKPESYHFWDRRMRIMMGEIPNNISHVSSPQVSRPKREIRIEPEAESSEDESNGKWLEWLMKNDNMEVPQCRIVKTEDV